MNAKMNQKEKVMGFAYVFLMFVAITATCCMLLFYYNSDFLKFTQKNFAVTKMNRLKEYRNSQSQAITTVDSLFYKINRFEPLVNAVYEENDINFMINQLKNNYEQHAWDARYKSFNHLASFYSMWFNDKKELWTKRDNIERQKKNLEECEIGLKNKKIDLILSSKK